MSVDHSEVQLQCRRRQKAMHQEQQTHLGILAGHLHASVHCWLLLLTTEHMLKHFLHKRRLQTRSVCSPRLLMPPGQGTAMMMSDSSLQTAAMMQMGGLDDSRQMHMLVSALKQPCHSPQLAGRTVDEPSLSAAGLHRAAK